MTCNDCRYLKWGCRIDMDGESESVLNPGDYCYICMVLPEIVEIESGDRMACRLFEEKNKEQEIERDI